MVDRFTHRLYKFKENNEFTILADKGHKEGELYFPTDLVVYKNIIYVADGGNYRIQAFDIDGRFLFSFSDEIAQYSNNGIFNGDGRSSNPQAIFIDENKNVCGVDIFNKIIHSYSQNGNYIKSITLNGLDSIYTIAADDNGDWYVTDAHKNELICYNRDKRVKWRIGRTGQKPGEFLGIYKVVLVEDQIMVSDVYNHRIQVFDNEGNYISQFGKYGKGPQEYNYMFSFCVDEQERMIITDTWNHRVKILKKNRECIWSMGGIDESILLRPSAVKISDDNEKIYVADYLNHRIAIFDFNGNYLEAFGELGDQNGQFSYPTDVDVSSENIYVADSKNMRIQCFDGEKKYVSDFTYEKENFIPTSVATHKESIFVADIGNSEILEFDKNTNKLVNVIATKGTKKGEIMAEYKTHFIRLTIQDDKMYIADTSNNRIQVFNLIDRSFTDDVFSEYNSPTRVLFEEGKLIVCDRGSHNISIRNLIQGDEKKIGIGKPGNKLKEFIAPWDIAYSKRDRILVVADSLNNRMQIINIEE